MEVNYFSLATALFIFICVAIFFMLFRALRFTASGAYRLPLVLLCAWMLLSSVLALSGFLQNFQNLPPRFVLVFIPPLFLMVFLLRSPRISALLHKVPAHWLVYAQSFRIPMEICLWLLFLGGHIPVQMSFEGRNFDVLAGITAIPAGYLIQKYGGKNKKLILTWNILGLLLLCNIVTIALLSTPSRLRLFMNDPANTIIAHFPYVLLPAFVVPFAYFLHAFSIKKALQE